MTLIKSIIPYWPVILIALTVIFVVDMNQPIPVCRWEDMMDEVNGGRK